MDDTIRAACRTHGARKVAAAAYAHMRGDLAALGRVDLTAANLAEADRIASIATGMMSPEDAAMDYAEAVVDAARVGSKHAD